MDNIELSKEVSCIISDVMLAASLKMDKNFKIYYDKYCDIINRLMENSLSTLFLSTVEFKRKPYISFLSDSEQNRRVKLYSVASKILNEVYQMKKDVEIDNCIYDYHNVLVKKIV